LVIGPETLARRLRLEPPRPLVLVTFIGNIHLELAFREMVHRSLPTAASGILAGRPARTAIRETARDAILSQMYFPGMRRTTRGLFPTHGSPARKERLSAPGAQLMAVGN
jgi:hypothetical protein